MNDTLPINIKKNTYDKLVLIQSVDLTLDDIINILIEEHNKVNKYIEGYIEGAKGKCICEVILGRPVIANHDFIAGLCRKCGIQAPIIKQDESKTVICIDNEVEQK